MDKFAQEYNYKTHARQFLQSLDDGDTHKEASETFSRVIRAFEREDSFAVKILPAQEITIDECQISTETQNEGFTYILFREPEGAAQYYTWQGTGDSEYIYAEKLEVPISKVGTRIFQKTEDELLSYKGIGLVEMVEKNAAKEISNIQDDIFLGFARNAVKNNGLDLDSAGKGLTRENFIDLINMPLAAKLRGNIVLMTETTWNNWLKQGNDVFGDPLLSEIIVNGYKHRSILGVPVITTIKNELLHDNEVFSFPKPEFLGRFLVMEDTKYVVEKFRGRVSWHCTKKFGLVFANTNGVARLKLNNFSD